MRNRFHIRPSTLNITLIIALLAGLILPLANARVSEAAPVATGDDEIIYIDTTGFIRVIDPNVPAGQQEIKWASPEGGWLDFATGDFNNDGDQEIVAITTNKLTIFDPVYRSTAGDADGEFDLVPWKRLYEQALPGRPNLIDAGNMDQNVAGDEIIVGYDVNEGTVKYRLEVLKTTDGKGTAWTTHLNPGYGAPWKFVTVGNINNVGSDDLVLIRDADWRVDAREVDNNLNLIFNRSGNSLFTYVHAAVGQMYAGGTGEVAIARTFAGTDQSPSVLIYQFKNNQWQIETSPNDDSLNYYPHPSFLFMADINGNGDDELILLRSVPAGAQSSRMFMVNRGSDQLPKFVSRLDSDNGYKVGAGGDVDGDGKDEVVIMRNNTIRNFYAPESGNAALFTDYPKATNSKSLRLADLDGSGYTAGPRFNASPDTINITLKAGTANPNTISVDLTNTGSGGSIPFTATNEGNSPWFTFSVGGASTPATIFINNIDATNLTPGSYTGRIRITSSNTSVLNQPYYITINLTVTPADFFVTPSTLGFVSLGDHSQIISQTVTINGLPGLKFSAAILDLPTINAAQQALGGMPGFGYITDAGEIVLSNNLGETFTAQLAQPDRGLLSAAATSWPSGVPWATAESTGNAIPDTLTVTVSPTLSSSAADTAVLVIIADERAGDTAENAVFVPLSLLKASGQIFLPFALKP